MNSWVWISGDSSDINNDLPWLVTINVVSIDNSPGALQGAMVWVDSQDRAWLLGGVRQSMCWISGYSSAVQWRALCFECGHGSYLVDGETVCEDCKAGKFADSRGQIDCIVCQTGTYSPLPGMTECQSCDLGKFSSSPEMSFCESCANGAGGITYFCGAQR
jgi:hypothetical protein